MYASLFACETRKQGVWMHSFNLLFAYENKETRYIHHYTHVY